MTNASTMASTRSGRAQVYARPARNCPAARLTGGLGRSSVARIPASAVIVKAKLAALTKKAGAVSPDAAPMSRPASAGPTSRAPLKIVEFRLTALASRPGPTISETKACRTGASMADAAPSPPARTKTCHRATPSVTTRMPSSRARTPMVAWVPISSRRLS